MTVDYKDIVACWDFDRLTPGGLLYDYGPHELHATPGAGAAAPTRNLDGSYYFDGGDNFLLSGTSQTRFYANAPTGDMTILSLVASQLAGGAYTIVGAPAFIAGSFYGWEFDETAAGGSHVYHFIGDATLPQSAATAPTLVQNNSRHVVCTTVETAPRWMVQSSRVAASWVGGAMAPCVYWPATVPTIGSGISNLWIGNMYYLCAIRGAISNDDLAFYSRMLMDGKKPHCVRT